ncbi:thioredoxin domain-containing protein [Fervidibacillus halotolerans]|uniref:Thioredoxin domain-containing protein n=1 Tax=Fervidibacillus halotolerans TaxID=2980027 RepID=A0A9E8M2E1_9BACI|nr:thioredoxin domain-containing protein [Fervidibacillus halotolerans]WAA13119.1 thioredoxin domain-containing protein [Fervidibacillus halotolerans]
MANNRKPNQLIHEKSPYLLQHAYQPVDWYPWGKEAFEKAKRENKPLLVSIGYSTCHWCHVMARETFEDEEVANILNERFVAVKVDREERPDIDSIYMKVCQMLTGQGGWPLHVFITPDQKPFYAGTYFPKESRFGRPGFVDVLLQLSQIYHHEQEKIEKTTTRIVEAIHQKANRNKKGELKSSVLHQAFHQLSNLFDPIYGGFGQAPKFPTPHMLQFLLKYYVWTKDEHALYMVNKTLMQLRKGGIWDHIGFGFSRYSTDPMWLVPHFEKMLYDNALLLYTFSEAYQLTKNPQYQRIAEQIITFIGRDMQHESGAFFSAIDADSDGEEGKFYVWTKQEIIEILGQELGETFCHVYGITEDGNFEGKNIPNLIFTNKEKLAKYNQKSLKDLEWKLEQARKLLLEKRSQRPFPLVDDKVLTGWNALMIAALAKAGAAFDQESYIQMAKRALDFIEHRLIVDGRVMVRYRDGEVKQKAFIDEYAYLLWAYIEMYEGTFDITYLHKSKQLVKKMMDLFWDQESGGFFFTGTDCETMLVKEKEIYDGALPSGNSVAAFSFLKLSRLTGNIDLYKRVQGMYSVFKEEVEQNPIGHTFFLQTILMEQFPPKEVVIIGSKHCNKRKKLLKQIQQAYTVNLFSLVVEDPKDLEQVAEFAKHYRPINEKTTVFICENFACQQPTTNIEEVRTFLNV